MEPLAFQPSMLLAILPEIGLVVLGALLLVLDLVWRGSRRRLLGWVTAGGLAVIALLAILFSRPESTPQLILGGMLRLDGTAFVFRLIFLTAAAITALLMVDQEPEGQQGEFYVLMLVATLGMNLMASAADLIMLYLAIETTSLPLYILAGFSTRDPKSAEAGIKYFLFGAMTAAVMLYGFSLLYGFSGTTNLYQMASKFSQFPPVVLGLAAMLVLVGFGFKVSAVPFHFWAPDVYEGAPTPVSGFLSTASKAAGFAVLMRVMLAVFSVQSSSPITQYLAYWPVLIAVMSLASMILGNVLAASQTNIKRLLAYSSIAQAGYMLAGVMSGSGLGYSAATYYLISYLVTNLAAFGIVTLVGRTIHSDEISAYSGLQRRNPALGLALLVALLSLGGIPPFSGFTGKLLVFGAAIQSGSLGTAVAIVGVITSVIGLYYYLRVIKVSFVGQAEGGNRPLPMTVPWRLALIVCVVGILFLGTVLGPWYQVSTLGGGSLFIR